MMDTPSYPSEHDRSSAVAASRARGRVGVFGVLAIVLAAAAPLTVVAGSAAAAFGVTGFVGVPVAYLAVGLLLAVFSAGYVAMARNIKHSGGFYVYVSQGLGKPAGLAAGAVSLVAYNVLQLSLYGGAGMAATVVGEQVMGWYLPWWTYALGIWVIVAFLGQLSITVNKRVLAAMLLAEAATVVIIDAVLLSHPAGGTVDFSALSPSLLWQPQSGAILVAGVAGYMGYESGVLLRDEARNPRTTIARATYIALAIIAVLYGLSTWALTVATGSGHIVDQAARHGPDLFFQLASRYLPMPLIDIGRAQLLTSLAAALIAFHGLIARLTFALSREGVLPRSLGRLGRRTGTPARASAAQSLLALLVLIVYIVADLRPVDDLFVPGGTMGGLGIVILMAAASAAVIRYFRTRPSWESRWRRIIAPAISLLVMVSLLVATVWGLPLLLRVPADSPLPWVLIATYVVVAVLGASWALVLRRYAPEVYGQIGHGPDSHHAVPRLPPAGGLASLARQSAAGETGAVRARRADSSSSAVRTSGE